MTRWNCAALVFVALLATIACQSADKDDEGKKPESTTKVADEVSLKSDRSQYDELRKDVPEEIKRENDEIAFTRGLMAEGTEEPSRVREKFSKAVRDRRDRYDKAARKRRDEFNRRERKMREDFLKKVKAERESFMSGKKKIDTDKRKEFFAEQDAQRNDFFADQKEQRKDFETSETESRKNFEAYLTEKRTQFDTDIREYTANFNDRRKNLDIKKRAEEKAKQKAKRDAESASREGTAQEETARPPTDPDLEQFKQIPNTPGTPLSPPDKEK